MSGNGGEKRTTTSTSEVAKKKIKTEAVESSAQPDLDILQKYKAWRQYAKALKRHDLLDGLTEISDISQKVSELRKRLAANGYNSSNPPTETEISEAENKSAQSEK
jgi:hypothetical protein